MLAMPNAGLLLWEVHAPCWVLRWEFSSLNSSGWRWAWRSLQQFPWPWCLWPWTPWHWVQQRILPSRSPSTMWVSIWVLFWVQVLCPSWHHLSKIIKDKRQLRVHGGVQYLWQHVCWPFWPCQWCVTTRWIFNELQALKPQNHMKWHQHSKAVLACGHRNSSLFWLFASSSTSQIWHNCNCLCRKQHNSCLVKPLTLPVRHKLLPIWGCWSLQWWLDVLQIMAESRWFSRLALQSRFVPCWLLRRMFGGSRLVDPCGYHSCLVRFWTVFALDFFWFSWCLWQRMSQRTRAVLAWHWVACRWKGKGQASLINDMLPPEAMRVKCKVSMFRSTLRNRVRSMHTAWRSLL